MANLRTKGKSTIVWVLMGLMVLGLGGFGVTSFTGGGSEIGRVGGTEITAEDYARALRQQMQALARQTGRQPSMAEAQAMGLTQAVQAQLVTGAALEEEAHRIGISVGDAQVARIIADVPAFKGPGGGFDRATYAQILRSEGMTEAEFERQLRADEARLMLQRAVTGGVVAPRPLVDLTANWLLESRDFSWRELTADDLIAPVADPDDATLEAWHKANADRFTAPEIRKITYAWVTPEMLAPEVQLDEAALRDLYQRRIDEFQQPERRMVSRLVFASEDEAAAAKARIDAGQESFEAAVLQRGLTLDDVDLGEMTRAQLGAAGDAVFALDGPGVVGPIQTDLGPALYSMNAILEPVDVSFEAARADLRAEAAIDRAARQIDEQSSEYEDLLAGGATLEELAQDTPLQIGQIDWSEGMTPEHGSISGYEAFRERAAAITPEDFPEITSLDDGGVFALRLDEVIAPALRPLDEVRDEVLADWRSAETQRQLLARADELRLHETAAATASAVAAVPGKGVAPAAGAPANATATAGPATGTPATAGPEAATDLASGGPDRSAVADWTPQTGLTRDGYVEGLPGEVIAAAFALDETGEISVADAGDRVFLVRLDAVRPADLAVDESRAVTDAVSGRIGQSLQNDLFDYFARAVQAQAGVELNQGAVNAVHTQVQ